MSKVSLCVAAILPDIIRAFFADVPLRLMDPGKWSDVRKFLDLIGGGKVLNICGRLRLWGSNDPFSGVRASVHVLPPSVHGGRIIVRAGADPSFNATCTFEQLRSGTFDKKELVLCVLSTIDFSPLCACDLDITILSPIPPGASLGTSASLGVAINRACLGSAYEPVEIAERTLEAELNICGKPTGNQDHLAAAFGSRLSVKTPVIMIEIRDLTDVTVTSVPVGPNIARYLRNVVVVFLGSHDSSEIHLGLQDHLAQNPDQAKELLCAMRDTADVTREAFRVDDAMSFVRAFEAVEAAQRNLSDKLISPVAGDLIVEARHYGGVSIVPGAGGIGGSVVCCFPDRRSCDFVRSVQSDHPALRFYEAECPGIE
jgi:galactokinase/mevalonate kinase-like predicted kinase